MATQSISLTSAFQSVAEGPGVAIVSFNEQRGDLTVHTSSNNSGITAWHSKKSGEPFPVHLAEGDFLHLRGRGDASVTFTQDRGANPGVGGASVTPHDSTDFATPARSLYVGTGGNVAVVALNGDVVTWANVPDGFIIPVECTRVNATGTTASNIVTIE